MMWLAYIGGFVLYAFAVAVWKRKFRAGWLCRHVDWMLDAQSWKDSPGPIGVLIVLIFCWPLHFLALLIAGLVKLWIYVAGLGPDEEGEEDKRCEHGYR